MTFKGFVFVSAPSQLLTCTQSQVEGHSTCKKYSDPFSSCTLGLFYFKMDAIAILFIDLALVRKVIENPMITQSETFVVEWPD